MPTCSVRSSGSVRAALFLMSSALITVTLAGRRRASSGKRVAFTTTESSVCAWMEKQSAAAEAASGKRTMKDLLGRHPRRRSQVDELQGRSPDSRAADFSAVPLTVAGAAQAFHLFPVSPATREPRRGHLATESPAIIGRRGADRGRKKRFSDAYFVHCRTSGTTFRNGPYFLTLR